MSNYSFFQMWEPHRQSLIAGHLFYVEQAKKRLLSQFQNIYDHENAVMPVWLSEVLGVKGNPPLANSKELSKHE